MKSGDKGEREEDRQNEEMTRKEVKDGGMMGQEEKKEKKHGRKWEQKQKEVEEQS